MSTLPLAFRDIVCTFLPSPSPPLPLPSPLPPPTTVTGGSTFYRYDQVRCLRWLTAKVHRLADRLQEEAVDVSQGSRAALLVSSRKQKATKGSCLSKTGKTSLQAPSPSPSPSPSPLPLPPSRGPCALCSWHDCRLPPTYSSLSAAGTPWVGWEQALPVAMVTTNVLRAPASPVCPTLTEASALHPGGVV